MTFSISKYFEQRGKARYSTRHSKRFRNYLKTLKPNEGKYNFLKLAGGKLYVKNKPRFINMFLRNFTKFSEKSNAGGLVFKVPKDHLAPLCIDIDIDLNSPADTNEEYASF